MEKFMFIFQGNVTGVKPSPEEMQANMGKWMTWIGELQANGKYASGEALLLGGKLISGSNKMVTDGPYVEGKEIVGGYFIVNATDYDEAVELSKGYPDFDKGGSVQIRQIMKMDM
ncbi:MAG TPA: YciI family protein [Panacibacter sp.]|nr:YciI family protein [Panacibacter sp.]